MSKSFPVLLVGSIASIFLSNVTYAQAPSVQAPSVQSADTKVPNVEGNWKMSIMGENLAPTYTLIQKGTALTGTFKGPMGELPLTGSLTSSPA
jgi:hypothetical protein